MGDKRVRFDLGSLTPLRNYNLIGKLSLCAPKEMSITSGKLREALCETKQHVARAPQVSWGKRQDCPPCGALVRMQRRRALRRVRSVMARSTYRAGTVLLKNELGREPGRPPGDHALTAMPCSAGLCWVSASS